MKIVTWNMNGWNRQGTHDQAWTFLLDTVRPDIALLQEAEVPENLPPEYRHKWTPAIAGRPFGSVILSRLGELDLQWEDNSRGAVLVANSSVTAIGPISIACIQARVEEGVGTIRWLRETIGAVRPLLGDRFILGGDLNTARQAHRAWPAYGHGQFWKDIETWDLYERLPLDGLEEQQSYWGRWLLNKPPTLGNTLQDDHVFLDAKTFASAHSCLVWDTKRVRELSDHGPVVVDLALPDESVRH